MLRDRHYVQWFCLFFYQNKREFGHLPTNITYLEEYFIRERGKRNGCI